MIIMGNTDNAQMAAPISKEAISTNSKLLVITVALTLIAHIRFAARKGEMRTDLSNM